MTMRIIKKYPNRRLYDTRASKYITLENVRKLVLDGVDFRVMDVKTEEDLTRNVLLQIIAEQEHEGRPIFNTPMLTQLIRCYGNAYQSAFSDYLQKSLELFAAQQQRMQKNFEQAVTGNPFVATVSEMTEQNLEAWRQLQNSFFQAAEFTGSDPEKED